VIAVDGKTVRGARVAGGRAVHLLAAFDTTSGTVLGQRVVDGKTNETNAFAPLLERIELADALVTADALHTQRGHVRYLRQRGAHYLLTVKANQPTLLRQLRSLPWAQVPVADQTRDKAHGRTETRTVKLTTVTAGIGFPAARTAVQITRRRRPSSTGKWHTETVHAITDLDVRQASAAILADAVRAHWGIENRLHWVRDVTFAEDLSQIRTGNGPAVMATLRNLAISLHRRAGATNIAAACRHVSRHPSRTLPLLLQRPDQQCRGPGSGSAQGLVDTFPTSLCRTITAGWDGRAVARSDAGLAHGAGRRPELWRNPPFVSRTASSNNTTAHTCGSSTRRWRR